MVACEYGMEDPTGWWMSEKLDGVRAWWDGEKFWSRDDNRFNCPECVAEQMPACVLDCEIWGGRGMFEPTVAAVRRNVPKVSEWESLVISIIDTPEETFTIHGGLEGRLIPGECCSIIPQTVCEGRDDLQEFFDKVVNESGEGVVLRAAQSPYVIGESKSLLKLKPRQEGVGVIVGRRGQDGNDKMMASVMLRWGNIVFAVGGGFTREERLSPVPVGKRIRFHYHFLSDSGTPKSAVKVGVYGF